MEGSAENRMEPMGQGDTARRAAGEAEEPPHTREGAGRGRERAAVTQGEMGGGGTMGEDTTNTTDQHTGRGTEGEAASAREQPPPGTGWDTPSEEAGHQGTTDECVQPREGGTAMLPPAAQQGVDTPAGVEQGEEEGTNRWNTDADPRRRPLKHAFEARQARARQEKEAEEEERRAATRQRKTATFQERTATCGVAKAHAMAWARRAQTAGIPEPHKAKAHTTETCAAEDAREVEAKRRLYGRLRDAGQGRWGAGRVWTEYRT